MTSAGHFVEGRVANAACFVKPLIARQQEAASQVPAQLRERGSCQSNGLPITR